MAQMRQLQGIKTSAFWRWVNRLSFVAVVAILITVIYGLALRATFEQSYWAACILAIAAAVFVLMALAQQTIAARDEATWREMADWQLKAATERVAESRRVNGQSCEGLPSPDDDDYYEQLLATLMDTMRQPSGADR